MKKRSFKIALVGIVTMAMLSLTGCSFDCNHVNNNKVEYNDKTLKFVYSIMGVDASFSKGPIGGPNHEGLAILIANTSSKFDINNGGAGAHRSNPRNREKFFHQLVSDINESGEYRLKADKMSLGDFVAQFEAEFGDLHDTDGDTIPDVLDDDDDNDNILDTEDDDNDGCLDGDEKDKNAGGVNGKKTGKGRGKGNEKVKDVPRDDPNFDPPLGSTTHLDDGM